MVILWARGGGGGGGERGRGAYINFAPIFNCYRVPLIH